MSKSGQQHSKADVGGQRPKTEKVADKSTSSSASKKPPASPTPAATNKG